MTAQVRNPRLLKSLVASCRKRGVNIVEECLVREVLLENDQVVGIRADTGDFACATAVVAPEPGRGKSDSVRQCCPFIRSEQMVFDEV